MGELPSHPHLAQFLDAMKPTVKLLATRCDNRAITSGEPNSSASRNSQFLRFNHSSLEALEVIWHGGNCTDIWRSIPTPWPLLGCTTSNAVLANESRSNCNWFTICCKVDAGPHPATGSATSVACCAVNASRTRCLGLQLRFQLVDTSRSSMKSLHSLTSSTTSRSRATS